MIYSCIWLFFTNIKIILHNIIFVNFYYALFDEGQEMTKISFNSGMLKQWIFIEHKIKTYSHPIQKLEGARKNLRQNSCGKSKAKVPVGRKRPSFLG